MAFKRASAIFVILFASFILAVYAQVESPSPTPNDAPRTLTSFQSNLIGCVTVAVSLFFLKEIA
ncbi:hypothetical protein PanWU01x14_244200 [Parasponia andersonii]|uniref:Arabinogalactan peptide n=1 Tax=Parasponia andersonii TaxID=3476 RepID=A0A2P5BF95_PARAD|nr:hypothetical protein PanWU01x14_244200 [Parasponia andersonii]